MSLPWSVRPKPAMDSCSLLKMAMRACSSARSATRRTLTPASYQSYVAHNSYADYRIGYHRLGGSWFALSGEGNGKIFYEKAMFSCGGQRINSFAMIYRSDQRHIFDRIVERIEDTFRPGPKC